jgi:hypothetical protein
VQKEIDGKKEREIQTGEMEGRDGGGGRIETERRDIGGAVERKR